MINYVKPDGKYRTSLIASAETALVCRYADRDGSYRLNAVAAEEGVSVIFFGCRRVRQGHQIAQWEASRSQESIISCSGMISSPSDVACGKSRQMQDCLLVVDKFIARF